MFDGALGGRSNGKEKVTEAIFVDTFCSPIVVLEYWISDVGTNDGGDGIGSTFFSAGGGLNFVNEIVCLDFGFIPCVNVWHLG